VMNRVGVSGKGKDVSIARAESVARLDSFVGPKS
jgi:hypothetical protein